MVGGRDAVVGVQFLDDRADLALVEEDAPLAEEQPQGLDALGLGQGSAPRPAVKPAVLGDTDVVQVCGVQAVA